MTRLVLPFQRAADLNGKPLDGAKLHFFVSGTNTPKNTYSDVGLSVPNDNPVEADNQGQFGEIFLNGTYRVLLTDKDDVVQPDYPADNVNTVQGLNLSGALNTARATVASHATTSAIWAAPANEIDFTGNLTITDLPAAPQPGASRILLIAGTPTFTDNAVLDVQGGTYLCSAGDRVIIDAITTVTFKITIQKADGTATALTDASTTVTGSVELLTDAEMVTGADTTRAGTAANMVAKMAAPGSIGGTTPAPAEFTTVGASGLISADGGQIAFPATQNPSANANTLDDYEEGAWTPTITFSGGNGTLSYTTNEGSYTKIGRLWICQGYINFTKGTASGNITVISGLPATISSDEALRGSTKMDFRDIGITNTMPLPIPTLGAATIDVFGILLADGSLVQYADTDCDTASQIYISISFYE